METPFQNHIEKSDFDHVYEPAEDSFLLIDAIEKDFLIISKDKPVFCLEIGSGSGVIITAFGMGFPNCFCLSTDINMRACEMTLKTGHYNKVKLDSVNMDLASNFVDDKFDIILFNPPYVVTDSDEISGFDISASWAGGKKGREVIDRLLPEIPKKLTVNGKFYLLLIEDNIPDEVIDIMKGFGFKFEILVRRKVRNEKQLVIKFFK